MTVFELLNKPCRGPFRILPTYDPLRPVKSKKIEERFVVCRPGKASVEAIRDMSARGFEVRGSRTESGNVFLEGFRKIGGNNGRGG